MPKLIQLKDSNGNIYPEIYRASDILVNRGNVPSDWKTIKNSGIYNCSNWRPGIPYSHSYYGILFVLNRIVNNSNYLAVIYFDADGNVFENVVWAGTEIGWKKII